MLTMILFTMLFDRQERGRKWQVLQEMHDTKVKARQTDRLDGFFVCGAKDCAQNQLE